MGGAAWYEAEGEHAVSPGAQKSHKTPRTRPLIQGCPFRGDGSGRHWSALSCSSLCGTHAQTPLREPCRPPPRAPLAMLVLCHSARPVSGALPVAFSPWGVRIWGSQLSTACLDRGEATVSGGRRSTSRRQQGCGPFGGSSGGSDPGLWRARGAAGVPVVATPPHSLPIPLCSPPLLSVSLVSTSVLGFGNRPGNPGRSYLKICSLTASTRTF